VPDYPVDLCGLPFAGGSNQRRGRGHQAQREGLWRNAWSAVALYTMCIEMLEAADDALRIVQGWHFRVGSAQLHRAPQRRFQQMIDGSRMLVRCAHVVHAGVYENAPQ